MKRKTVIAVLANVAAQNLIPEGVGKGQAPRTLIRKDEIGVVEAFDPESGAIVVDFGGGLGYKILHKNWVEVRVAASDE